MTRSSYQQFQRLTELDTVADAAGFLVTWEIEDNWPMVHDARTGRQLQDHRLDGLAADYVLDGIGTPHCTVAAMVRLTRTAKRARKGRTS